MFLNPPNASFSSLYKNLATIRRSGPDLRVFVKLKLML